MPDNEQIAKPETAGALAAKERAIASSQVDHAAIYAHVAATKPQIFGAPQFSICPQCDNQYRLFNNLLWKGDQSVCQACADENFALTRDKMQKIERSYAEIELQERIAAEERPQITGPFVALFGAYA